MRILLVEDSGRLRQSISLALRKTGYAVDETGNGPEGLWLARGHEYDVIILDIMLPGLDGLSILRTLRQEGKKAHVLILTARDTVEDRVRGLHQGADDYLIKPFALDELLARVAALCRRSHGVKNPCVRIADLEIDTGSRTVRRGGATLDLTAREYSLLEYLAVRQGQVVSRTEIETHLYDEQAEPMSNVVDCAVYALRRKIDPADRPSIIQTRRGMGYILKDPATGA